MTKTRVKPQKTQEEIEQMERNRRYAGYKMRILNNCKAGRMREMELQLEYFERNSLARTPEEVDLTREEAIEAFKDSLTKYKEFLKEAKGAK